MEGSRLTINAGARTASIWGLSMKLSPHGRSLAVSNTIKDTLVELLRDAKAELKLVERERDKFHEDADAFLDKMAKYQERAIDAERKLAATRALADRLAEALRVLCETLLADKPRDITEFLNKAVDAITAWKEARND